MKDPYWKTGEIVVIHWATVYPELAMVISIMTNSSSIEYYSHDGIMVMTSKGETTVIGIQSAISLQLWASFCEGKELRKKARRTP